MAEVSVLIVYDSVTGNVEAMAEAVKDGVIEAGGTATLKRADEVDAASLNQYDAYAFGSPTHCGTMSTKMNDFFNSKLHKHWGKLGNKVAVAFSSAGGLGGGSEIVLLSMLSVIINFGMITFGIPDYVSRNVTLHYGSVSIKKPDVDALNSSRLLGRKLVEHTRVIKKGLAS
ncbi:flavodoxin family protein [Candidatus Bathyarchaeota archaeon]|nr:flavodoxin family protein [Candidatus Bathyarchaeota archaeon]